MPLKIEKYKPHFLEIATVTVNAGSTSDIEYTFSDDLIISRLFIWSIDGSSLFNVFITGRIEDEYFTHDSVPAQIFNTDRRDAYELNWKVTNGTKLYLSITNNTASALTLRVFAEVTK